MSYEFLSKKNILLNIELKNYFSTKNKKIQVDTVKIDKMFSLSYTFANNYQN